jgi:uncharacterized protein
LKLGASFLARSAKTRQKCSHPQAGEVYGANFPKFPGGIIESHVLLHQDGATDSWDGKNPKEMSVAELKAELTRRNLSTGGKTDILVKRLESILWVEKR